jgi:transposase
MITPQKRDAVFLLHQEGMPLREISRRLGLSRNSVRRIIAQEGPSAARSFTPPIDPELLRELYHQCEGYVQRVFEKLQEEHGLAIKYSSLTRWLRQLGISLPAQTRCDRVPDEPGAEMQHCFPRGQISLIDNYATSLMPLRHGQTTAHRNTLGTPPHAGAG